MLIHHSHTHILHNNTPENVAEKSLATTYDAAYTWVELSKSAFMHNMVLYKKIIGNNVQLGVVVKGNAYGHGIKQLGLLCQANSLVEWLYTTSLSEALVLRSIGVTKPILVTGIIDDDPLNAAEHNIDLLAYTPTTMQALNNAGSQAKKAINVHVKIDTGMSRFGVVPHEAFALIMYARSLPFITINGIYSHFADSDSGDKSYTEQQLLQFNMLLNQLEQKNIIIPYKHTGNSAAVICQPNSHYNLVRIGAGAYGLSPSPKAIEYAQRHYETFELQPIMSWKTRILDIRVIPPETSIGYNRTHITKTPTTIGIIPIGYYEGYDRRLSNNGIVALLKEGSFLGYAPIIGRICMNVTMIDISSFADIHLGDEVVLIGNYAATRADAIAAHIGSFNPREITARINTSIPRIIVP